MSTRNTMSRKRSLPAALEHLGVTSKELDDVAPVTPLLRRLCGVKKGGEFMSEPHRKKVLNYIKYNDSSEAKRFLKAYDAENLTDEDRDCLPMEAYCIKAGITTNRLLEMVLGSFVNMNAQLSTITAMVDHPQVVERTVKFAKTLAGAKHAEMLYRATGFLPSPRGAQTIVNVNQNAALVSKASTAQLPPMDTMIRSISDRFNEKLIEGNVQTEDGHLLEKKD